MQTRSHFTTNFGFSALDSVLGILIVALCRDFHFEDLFLLSLTFPVGATLVGQKFVISFGHSSLWECY